MDGEKGGSGVRLCPFLNGTAAWQGTEEGGSVAQRDTWRRGWGVRSVGGGPTDSGPAATCMGGVELSEQGSTRGL
jgi:hypothetical protein